MYFLIGTSDAESFNISSWPIKDLIDNRVAFRFETEEESKAVLDLNAATELLGCGHLIYSTPNHTIKVQSPTVSKREIKRVTDYIKENKKELYVERLRHFPKATDLEE